MNVASTFAHFGDDVTVVSTELEISVASHLNWSLFVCDVLTHDGNWWLIICHASIVSCYSCRGLVGEIHFSWVIQSHPWSAVVDPGWRCVPRSVHSHEELNWTAAENVWLQTLLLSCPWQGRSVSTFLRCREHRVWRCSVGGWRMGQRKSM